MMPDKSQGGLLARLQNLSGCQYLSDLHSPFYIDDIIYAVRTVSISSYSMGEWEEAFRYITGVRMEFRSKDELIKNLILRLEENREL
jgi:hypothetical protein